MAIGVSAAKGWFSMAPMLVLAVLMAGAESAALGAEDPVEPAVAEPALRGFELLEAYQAKQNRLKLFLREHNLESLASQDQKSPAADEGDRLIGGLQLLMDQEAERLFHEAMRSQNLEYRDSILKKLRQGNYSPKVSNQVKQEFEKRTVENRLDAEATQPFPTVEEAQAAEKRLKEQQEQQQADRAKKDLQDLNQLKDQLMTEPISEAAQKFAEEAAQKQFTAALRLVPTQRREHLREIVRKYPSTTVGKEAQAILTAMKQQREFLADQKLGEALRAPVNFDQRWRRMKELLNQYPNTKAAAEAEQIFEQHAAQVPPAVLTNETRRAVELTWDVPYNRLRRANLAAGQTESFKTAFPMLVRVQVTESEWQPYKVMPGGRYFLRTGPAQVPILFDEFGVVAGKTIVHPQFGRPLPKAPPGPPWTYPHLFPCPTLYGY